MKRKSVFNLSKILVFALLPYLSVSVINGSERILLNYRPDSEVYLTAVLSCQISPDYELQTVEAQAVIARSNLFRKFAEEENRLDVLREMGKSIKNQWKWWISDEIYEDAVENTEGKVLLVDGKLDLVPYHEISGGTTRDGETVFGSSEYQYLKSVDSSADKNSPDYFHRRIFPYRKQGVKFVSCAEEKVMDLAFLSMAEMNLQKMEVCGKRFWKNIFRKWK